MKAIFSLIPYLIFKLTKLRVIVVSITIFTVLFSIYKATSLKFDGDISKMVEKKIETGKEEKQRLKTLFGNNNIIVLYIRNEATVLNTATINMLFDIANYVKGNNLFKEFHSLAQFKNLVNENGTLSAVPLLLQNMPDGEIANKIKAAKDIKGNFISDDNKSTIMAFDVDESLSNDENYEHSLKVENFIKEYLKSHKLESQIRFYFMGGPYTNETMTLEILRESKKLLPISLLFLAFVIILSFKSAIPFLISFSSIIISILITIGTMAFFNVPMRIGTSFIPILLLATGSSYSTHFLTVFYDNYRTKKQPILIAIKNTIYHNFVPLFLAWFTTAIGYFSLIFSDIKSVIEFGIFNTIGVNVAGFLSLFLVPSILVMIYHNAAPIKVEHKASKKPTLQKINIVDQMIKFITNFGVNNSYAIFAITLLITGGSLFFISDIRTTMDLAKVFKADHFFMKNMNEINHDFTIGFTIDVVLESKEKKFFKKASNIAKLEQFQERLLEIPGIDKATSVVNIFKNLNYSTNRSMSDFYKLGTDEEIENNLFLLSFDEKSPLYSYVGNNFKATKIQIRSHYTDSENMKIVLKKVEELKNSFYGADIKMSFLSDVVDNFKNTDLITDEQVSSISFTAIVIFILMLIMYRSFKIAIIAIIPNIIPIVIIFGFMGLTGIPLDTSTICVASVSLGIAVDDTIHFLSEYMNTLGQMNYFFLKEKLGNHSKIIIREAITETLRHSCTATIRSSASLIFGFGILMLSFVTTYFYMGLLTAITLFIGLFCDLFLLPAILNKVKL